MSPEQNPFRYGEVATGSQFTNRTRELAELVSDVRSGQNVVLISPRRYGKTSLIVEAIRQVRAERVLVAYVDLFRTPTLELFASHLASGVYSGLVAPFERVLQRAADVFRHLALRPRVTINEDATPSFEFTSGGTNEDAMRTVENLLEIPARIARERKRRVALILDEFQEVVDIDPHLPAVMRSIFQTQADVAHVYLGSRQHLMRRLFTTQHEPFYRSAKHMPLGPISVGDFAEFIAARFAEGAVEIDADAVQSVLEITHGHPHDTQELCFFLWSEARAIGRRATTETVLRALDLALGAEDARCTAVWVALSTHQRLVLRALAIERGQAYSEAYRLRHHLGPASSVGRSLKRLVEQDLVEQDVRTNTYGVQDLFLRLWLERVAAAPDQAPARRS